jgi:hypothetical protein
MPIKLMAASRRRPGLTRAEYQRYIEFYHGTIARQERFFIQSYVQNHVTTALRHPGGRKAEQRTGRRWSCTSTTSRHAAR